MTSTTTAFAALALSVSLCASLPCQWQMLSPTTSPGPLQGQVMAADLTGTILMATGSGGGFGFSNAAWLYSGGNWTAAPSGPSGRWEAQIVYDALRGRWVLYGGWTSPFSIGSGNDETWEFDGSNWTQVTTANTPGGFWKHAMAFDIARGVTVLYGGATSGLPGATDGTYEFDGTNWTAMVPQNTPGWRENHSMAYHQGLARTVLFGGYNPLSNSFTDETWLYDGVNWTQATIAGPVPPARASAEMVYDSARDVCVLHGGNDASGAPYDDTWEFDGSSWRQIVGSGPGDRSFGMAYDAANRQVVRYGGNNHLSEMWALGATSTMFGSGCTGSNGAVALTPANAPRTGQNYSQTLSNLNPAVPIAAGVLSLNEIAPTPLDPVGMTGCTAYVTPDLVVSLVAAAGSATWDTAIPANPSLVGTRLFAQGLSIDPGANPAWLVSSNATEGVLGL